VSKLRILENLVFEDTVTITSSSEDAAFPVSNLKSQLRSKVWRTTDSASQWVLFDLKTTEDIDSFVVLFRANSSIKISSGANIRLQASATTDFSMPPVDIVLDIDSDNLTASHYFENAESYRYWRLYVDDVASAWGYIEVSNVVISGSTVVSSVENGFSWEYVDRSKESRTDYGQKYYDTFPIVRTMGVKFAVLDYPEVEELMNIFQRVGKTEAICMVQDPEEKVFDKDRFFVYGNIKSFKPAHKRYIYFDVSVSIEEQL